MGKKKKITEKVRLFYRGPSKEPTKIADQDDMQIITNALKDSSVNKAYKSIWNGQEIKLRLLFGLNSSLRHLKRGQTRAIIYDDTASIHLTKFLQQFAFKLKIPIIQAHKLTELVDNPGIQSLLVVTIVEIQDTQKSIQEETVYRSFDPRPKPIEGTVVSDKVEKLFQLLQTVTAITTKSFRPPILDKVVSTGKNRAKKEAKKNLKKTKKKEKSIESK